jgi:hypothetical protein
MRFSLMSSSSKLRTFAIASMCLSIGCSDDDPASSTVTGPGNSNGSGEPGNVPGNGSGSGPEQYLGGLNPDGTVLTGLVDGEEQAPACSDRFEPAAARPPLIQFVVDTSGSMERVAGTQRTPANGERSKWQITQQALATAIAAMPDDVVVGVSYYPNIEGDDDTCFLPEVAAPLAPLNAEQRGLIEKVNAAKQPLGGTPTHSAYDFGVKQLLGSTLEGPRFLLLITDGTPTYTLACTGNGRDRVPGEPLIQEVQQRFTDNGVRTFVIGSPGSEDARDELSEMAEVGGTANPGCSKSGPAFCHFDMTAEPDFSMALNRTLAEITQATLACDYAVPTPPSGLRIDLNQVSVVLESGGSNVREFVRAGSADCESGWQYAANQSSVHLCPSTCAELQGLLRDDPGLDVRIKFGCSSMPH